MAKNFQGKVVAEKNQHDQDVNNTAYRKQIAQLKFDIKEIRENFASLSFIRAEFATSDKNLDKLRDYALKLPTKEYLKDEISDLEDEIIRIKSTLSSEYLKKNDSKI